MREAGKIVADVLDLLQKYIKEGVSTLELDQIAEKHIRSYKAEPGFKGYHGYPATICASLNHEVVHGIPRADKVLKAGDILSVDVGVQKNGYFGDMAKTFAVGQISNNVQRLLDVTKQSLNIAIEQMFVNNRLYTLSNAIQTYVEENGFSVVRDYVGHGIGHKMHEDPQIPNYGKKGHGPRIKMGMVFAIEPMVNMGTYETQVLEDGWTVVTKDRKLSAHFEHTVALMENGPEILTHG